MDLTRPWSRRGFIALALALSPTLIEARRRKKKKRRPDPAPIDPIELTGSGSRVTDSFRLPKGRYLIAGDYTTSTVTGGLFFVNLFGPNEFNDFVFIENPLGPGNYHYEAISEVPVGGSFFFEVREADGDWRLRVESR